MGVPAPVTSNLYRDDIVTLPCIFCHVCQHSNGTGTWDRSGVGKASGHILPSCGRMATPFGSSIASHRSIDFFRHRRPNMFSLPVAGKQNHISFQFWPFGAALCPPQQDSIATKIPSKHPGWRGRGAAKGKIATSGKGHSVPSLFPGRCVSPGRLGRWVTGSHLGSSLYLTKSLWPSGLLHLLLHY